MHNVYMHETSRLRFRPLEIGDERYIFPEVDEELTRHWVTWEPFADLAQARTYVAHALSRPADIWLLAFDKTTDEFIGCGSVTEDDDHPGEYEIGVWVKKSVQRKGFGREILEAVIEQAREKLTVDHLVYSVTEGNEASAAIARDLKAPLFRELDFEKRGVIRHVRDYRVSLR